MRYGALLAGGSGKRMKTLSVPKQFAEIGGIPIIIYSLRKMLEVEKFSKIIVAMNIDWIGYASDLFNKYLTSCELDQVVIIPGGKERLDSFSNVAKYIRANYPINQEDIVICHEAVRPFVLTEMIEKCIKYTLSDKIAATFLPVNDTIFSKDEKGFVIASEDRCYQVQGQTPSGFNIELLLDVLSGLTVEESKKNTGTTQLFLNRGYKIPVVTGNTENFKITTDIDLAIAEVMINKEKNNE